MADNIAFSDSSKDQVQQPSLDPSASVLERAEKAVKEINEGIARLEKLKADNESIAARIALSGRSDAGYSPKVETVISDVEYSKRFFNTGAV